MASNMIITTNSGHICPVCRVTVHSGQTLDVHMATHSKEEVVRALLNQQQSAQPHQVVQASQQTISMQQIISGTAAGAASASTSTPSLVLRPASALFPQQTSTAAAATAPILMPMFVNPVVSQASGEAGGGGAGASTGSNEGSSATSTTPYLIPQANGLPPLLFNMPTPNYIFPNFLSPFSGAHPFAAALAAAAATSVSVPPQQQQVQIPQQQPSVTITTSTSANSGSLASRLTEQQPPAAATSQQSAVTVTPALPTQQPQSLQLSAPAITVTTSAANVDPPNCRNNTTEAEPVPSTSRQAKLHQQQQQRHQSFNEVQDQPISLVRTYERKKPKEEPLHSKKERHESSGVSIKLIQNKPSPSAANSQEVPQSQRVKSTSRHPSNSSTSGIPLLTRTPSGLDFATAASASGCTEYASDSPYPAASINFNNLLLDPSTSISQHQQTPSLLSPQAGMTTVIQKQQPQPSHPQEEEINVVDTERPKASTSRGLSTAKPKIDEKKMCSVQTVLSISDLQKALKSDDDVQIVVPNDLMETQEFKTFISGLSGMPNGGSGGLVSSNYDEGDEDRKPNLTEAGKSGLKKCAAPPNTPNVTRPPSATPPAPTTNSFLQRQTSTEDQKPTFYIGPPQDESTRMSAASPQPSTSRDMTMANAEEEKRPKVEKAANDSTTAQAAGSNNTSSVMAILPDQLNDSDDDITLEDLVAMETMEEAEADMGPAAEDEDDHFFTLSSGATNPLEPFMNAIIQSGGGEPAMGYDSGFSCDACGLTFPCADRFRDHRNICRLSRVSSVVKGKISKSSTKARVKSSANVLRLNNENSLPTPKPSTSQLAAALLAESEKPLNLEQKQLPPQQLEAAIESNSNLDSKEKVKQEIFEIKKEAASTSVNTTTRIIHDVASQPVLGDTADNGTESWRCNYCRATFPSGSELMAHYNSIKESQHKCLICHIIFEDRKSALMHKKSMHPTQAMLQESSANSPAIPDQSSSAVAPVVKVEPTPNENGEYVCDKCDRAFKDKDLWSSHISVHVEEKPHECLECGKRFAKVTLLRDHRKRHFETGNFECRFCQKRFYTPLKLREHERIHTGEAPLSCNICGKHFRRHSNLSEHKRIHQKDKLPPAQKKELFCSYCGKIFTNQRDLDWHKEGEHEKEPKKCNFCGEIFVHSSSLTRHIRLKHEANFLPKDKKANLYANCPICQQTFYKTSINKHIRIKHQGQKPFKCDICQQSFVTKGNLDNHMWQHKNVRSRPFKCTLCWKAYLRQSLLDAHMRSHKGIKPFVCNECGLQFARKTNWQRHVAEHDGARNYECPTCGKRFTRGYYLTDHLKVHTGEKPYSCGICGKTAATRSNYNAHLRTHITREPVNSEV